MLISHKEMPRMAINKYLISISCYTTLYGAQVLIDLFFFRVILVIATEGSIIGLTGTDGYFCAFTKPNNVFLRQLSGIKIHSKHNQKFTCI